MSILVKFALTFGFSSDAEVRKITFVLCKLAAMRQKRASLKNERIMGCGLLCLMEVKPLWLSSRARLMSAHTFRGISQGFPTVQTSASICLCAEMHKRRQYLPERGAHCHAVFTLAAVFRQRSHLL